MGTGSTTTISGIPFNASSTMPTIMGGVVTYIGGLAVAALAIGVYAQASNIYFEARNSSSTGATIQGPAVIGNGFDVYAEIILLMINVTKNNQVTLQDGNLYFNNELDLTKYNSLIAKANEAEIKSKVALTEYNSAFEKFKKAIEDASK